MILRVPGEPPRRVTHTVSAVDAIPTLLGLARIPKLERFLAAALGELDLAATTMIVTSDHGNIEDLGSKSHTHNPVPTLVLGAEAEELAPRLTRLEDFAEAVLEHLDAAPEG